MFFFGDLQVSIGILSSSLGESTMPTLEFEVIGLCWLEFHESFKHGIVLVVSSVKGLTPFLLSVV
jgi:hypothetical protein